MKTPPHNLDAEYSVLGGIMVEPESLDEVIDLITPDDFYKLAHRKVFAAIIDLHNRGDAVDILTVSNHLNKRQELDSIGGPSTLAEIVQRVPAAINMEGHSKIIKEKALLRRLITTQSELITSAYEESFDNIETFIDEVETKIFQITEQKETGAGLVGAAELIKKSIDTLTELSTLKREVTGISSGFSSLDKMTAGFQPGDLVIVAARPSMGKTAFSLNIALNAALENQKKVAFFSIEMGKEQLMMRLLASEAKVNLSDIRVGRIRDTEWPRLIEKASKLGETSLYIDDTSSISPNEIRAKCRRLKARFGLDMILIDYLQIMGLKQKVESRERAVAEISRSLKAIAKELQVPVIALAQLNRGVEGRSGDLRKPVLSDLRESGSIEQDADLIMMLYREEYYEPDNPEIKGQADLLIRKHRNGPVGDVKLKWEAAHGRFSEWTDTQQRPPATKNNFTPNPPSRDGKPRNFAPGQNN